VHVWSYLQHASYLTVFTHFVGLVDTDVSELHVGDEKQTGSNKSDMERVLKGFGACDAFLEIHAEGCKAKLSIFFNILGVIILTFSLIGYIILQTILLFWWRQHKVPLFTLLFNILNKNGILASSISSGFFSILIKKYRTVMKA
ncbi:hypothetical protein ACJX0J_035070, partial [Zea mays]